MKLEKMSFDVKFDRPINKDRHYISPGGYNLNGKSFDFCMFEGVIVDPDTLRCYISDFDIEYAEDNGVDAVVPADIMGKFSEFYIYTGEYDDEPINPVKIDNLQFCFDGVTFNCPSPTLESANQCIFAA